jgi:hypothetical protein
MALVEGGRDLRRGIQGDDHLCVWGGGGGPASICMTPSLARDMLHIVLPT